MSLITKFATALCLASYTAALELASTTKSFTMAKQGTDFFAKIGTDCMACTPELFDVVEPMNNWTFQYVITTGNLEPEWANENGVELVPMISQSSIELMDGSWCTFRSPATDVQGKNIPVTVECTPEMLVETLKNTQSQLTVPMQFLLGWNEPYVKPQAGNTKKKNQKQVFPTDAVEWWRNVVAPAAAEVGLKLVTPTTGAPKQKVAWMSQFLSGCWSMRNEETNPCDVNAIEAFSVHDYKCAESYWEENYAMGTGVFQTKMIQQLKAATADDNDDEINWSDYVNNMPIWVQETSCVGDPTLPTAADACKRITQQAGAEYGQGSVHWMNANANVERWAWYTTFNTKTQGSNAATRLVNADGELLPLGRALMSEQDPTTDCDAQPQS